MAIIVYFQYFSINPHFCGVFFSAMQSIRKDIARNFKRDNFNKIQSNKMLFIYLFMLNIHSRFIIHKIWDSSNSIVNWCVEFFSWKLSLELINTSDYFFSSILYRNLSLLHKLYCIYCFYDAFSIFFINQLKWIKQWLIYKLLLHRLLCSMAMQ